MVKPDTFTLSPIAPLAVFSSGVDESLVKSSMTWQAITVPYNSFSAVARMRSGEGGIMLREVFLYLPTLWDHSSHNDQRVPLPNAGLSMCDDPQTGSGEPKLLRLNQELACTNNVRVLDE